MFSGSGLLPGSGDSAVLGLGFWNLITRVWFWVVGLGFRLWNLLVTRVWFWVVGLVFFCVFGKGQCCTKVCLDAPANMAFVPCGHLAVCEARTLHPKPSSPKPLNPKP